MSLTALFKSILSKLQFKLNSKMPDALEKKVIDEFVASPQLMTTKESTRYYNQLKKLVE